jgi:hypothetical protein
MWDESVDKFTLGLTTADGSATGNITLSSLGTLVANIEGNVTGAITGTVSSLSNHDTDDLTEGSNLYYTQARFDSALAAKSTSDLSEGTNLYYTDARFDTRLASKDTDDVSEGTSNLYYTSTRFDSAFGGKSTSDLSEGSNLYYTDARVQAISINNVVEDTTPQLGGDLASNGNDILFADNDKAVFGAGSDLQIYHDGNHSRIVESGGGDMIIQGDEFSLMNVAGDEYMIFADNDSFVKLYYDGSNKLATTSTGIDVTGTATMDGLTVDGNVGIGNTSPANKLAVNGGLSVEGAAAAAISEGLLIDYSTNLARFLTYDSSTGSEIAFYTQPSGGSTAERVRIDSSGNTTFKTSAGHLSVEALGGSSVKLNSNGSMGMNVASGFSYEIDVGGSEVMRIDSSGNVGIGQTSPNVPLEIQSATPAVMLTDSDTGNSGVIEQDGTDLYYGNSSSSGTHIFKNNSSNRGRPSVNGNELMRIDSSGNVGIRATPKAYHSDYKAIDINNSASVMGYTGNNGAWLMENLYYGTDNNWKHKNSDFSALVGMYDGVFNFYNTASGTAGATATLQNRLKIDQSGNVGIGDPSPSTKLSITAGSANGIELNQDSDLASDSARLFFSSSSGGYSIFNTSGSLRFSSGATAGSSSGTERMRVDSSGNLLVGKTSSGVATAGHELFANGTAWHTKNSGNPMALSRLTSDGSILEFYKASTLVGSIGINSSTLQIGTGNTQLAFSDADDAFFVKNEAGANRDGSHDLGKSNVRFNDIYATNGTIQTSDRNEKQDIENLTEAETRVAVAAKGLLRKFKWKSAVKEKGDEARIHFGIIAQDLQDAFTAEGLDAGDYAMWCSDTWTDEETGEEKTRLGVRYSELLAFIIASL